MRARHRAAALVAGLGALASVLAGCAAPGGGQGAAGGSAAPETAAPAPSNAAAGTSYRPGAGPEANLAVFDAVNERTLAGDPKAGSRALVDALVAAGFPKGSMEVTFDRTSVDLEADYVMVAVQVGGRCLVGQRAASGYASELADPLSDGACLIGETQPIDW